VFGAQLGTVEMDVTNVFKNILNTALVQLTEDETNRYPQQKILKNVNPFTFCLKIM
jgi:hypothetical protein